MIGIDTSVKRILDHYGQQKQEVQAVQELSELILLLAAREDQRKGDEAQQRAGQPRAKAAPATFAPARGAGVFLAVGLFVVHAYHLAGQ